MNKMMLKACTRCSGDMALRDDWEAGLYATCLQCGYVAYMRSPRSVAVGTAA